MRLICVKKQFAADIEQADTYAKRFCGLMFRRHFERGRALLLCPCSSIHTCFMKFTIDVLYLSKENVIICKETIKPWRIGKLLKGVKKIAEFYEGEAKSLEVGDILTFDYSEI